ncbi:MAG: glycoside hydrolase family 88 protein [Acidobacteria bacterium]|nr:glycoside hydrolase family 88 protein [Acidobacteriota bacterium]
MPVTGGVTRRDGIGLLAGALFAPRLPRGVPPGVAAILERTLALDPSALNTDWFGTLLVKGLLDWARRGRAEARDFARRWFESHLRSGRLSAFSGPKSRVVQAGGIAITTYAGHFGLAFPCYELFLQTGDARARRVCVEVADVILHQTARNHLGMVLHDDTVEFTIPDVCYFVVTPLMIAYALDPARHGVYRDQAVFQLRAFIDVFLSKETGLAKTILTKEGLGKSYWTRATGWLLWAMTGVLRHLPPGEVRFAGFARDLASLAGGIERVQDPGGGLRLFLNDPHSPLETTGTAMCAMGLHEAIRRNWLDARFSPVAERAWSFVLDRLSPAGEISGAYTGWAVPAERGVVEMDRRPMGWIPGFVLSAASEMATRA